MENLIEGLTNQLIRANEIKRQYEELGLVGAFGLHFVKQEIERAKKAQSSGDVIEMISAFNALKGLK